MSDTLPQAIYNPWRESLENCISGDNYLRAGEYRELIAELDDLYRLRALAARQQQVPEGFVLVPVEPTESMLRALTDPFIAVNGDNRAAFLKAWKVMLAAAPQAAQPEPACTCPSGDGSLRWPCPEHPPEQAQQSTRTEGEGEAYTEGYFDGAKDERASILARLEAVPVPDHPEPWAWRWSDSEQRAISNYRAAMLAAAKGVME